MHILGYIVICIIPAYAAIYVFSFGWSTEPVSFLNVFYHVAAYTIPAGVVAATPKKTTFKVASIFAILFPAMITSVMLQGLLGNLAFDQLHWTALPIGGAALAVFSFFITKKIMTILHRTKSETNSYK
jgi:hypothetical protein